MRRWWIELLVITATMLSACSDTLAPTTPLAIDSAGVSILTIPAMLAAAVAIDTLSDPVWTLGGGDTDAEHDMTGVRSAAFMGAAIVVADAQSVTLRKYGLDGKLLATGAGRGGGPGELARMGAIAVADSTGLILTDGYSGRLLWYDDTLGFVRQQLLRNLPGGMRYGLVGVRQSGSLLFLGGPAGMPERTGDGTIIRPSEVVEQVDLATERVDTLFILPGGEFYFIAGVGTRGRRFAMVPALVVTDSGFIVSNGDRWDIRWLNSTGKLRRIVRLDRPRRVVTEAMRAAQLRLDHAEIDELPPGGFAEIRRMAKLDFDDPHFPDSLPPFDKVVGDHSGNAWFREGTAPTDSIDQWLVFGGEELERVVAIPVSLRVMAVRDSLVLVRREDSDGIGYLELRRVVR